MDAIVPILFVVAFFLFQGYLNYKKEQEKAKKRNLGTNPKSSSQTAKSIESVPEKYIHQKYEQVRYQPTETPPDLLKEYRNLPEKREMEEVKRSKMLRQAHQHELRRLQSPVIGEEEIHANDFPEFNFRDAIVMNAILERPYQ